MKILQIEPALAPLHLLALADPSFCRVQSYLNESAVWVGEEEGVIVSIAVVQRRNEELELLNLAVAENRQGCGFGAEMLAHVLGLAELNDLARVVVGTGNSSLRQQAFYQKTGFRISGVVRDFFRDDDPPIFEGGIRCLDMVRLSFEVKKRNLQTAPAQPKP